MLSAIQDMLKGLQLQVFFDVLTPRIFQQLCKPSSDGSVLVHVAHHPWCDGCNDICRYLYPPRPCDRS